MSSSQNRSDGSNRPMMWIKGTGGVLFVVGFLITVITAADILVGTWPWAKAGAFLMALSLFVLFTIPGALLAMRHRWVAGYGSMLAPHYPQLGGLAEAWIGTIICMWMLVLGRDAPISLPFLKTQSAQFVTAGVLFLCTFIPWMAVLLYERRH